MFSVINAKTHLLPLPVKRKLCKYYLRFSDTYTIRISKLD